MKKLIFLSFLFLTVIGWKKPSENFQKRCVYYSEQDSVCGQSGRRVQVKDYINVYVTIDNK